MQFCTFYLEQNLFGVAVLDVQEVVRQHEITVVPLAPRAVRGLINLRGHVVPAVDLRRKLHLSDREQHQLPINIVLRTDDGLVSLLVDEILDVLVRRGIRTAPSFAIVQVEGEAVRALV